MAPLRPAGYLSPQHCFRPFYVDWHQLLRVTSLDLDTMFTVHAREIPQVTRLRRLL